MTFSKQSTLASQNLPEFIRNDYPMFAAFVEAYYEYLTQNTVGPNLISAKDLDNTLDVFIESFKRDFASNIPDMTYLSTKDFLRNAKAFYTARGTEASFKFLFRAMYGKEISVYYPETEIFRASDGRWTQETSTVVQLIAGDASVCAGQRVSINGSTTSEIRLVNRVRFIRDNFYELFFDSNSYLNLQPGYTVTCGTFMGVCGYVIDKVVVTKPGTGFRVGQIFSVNDSTGTGAKIRVKRIDANGGILVAEPVAFGAGYSGATYYGRLIAKFSAALINPISSQSDHTGGTSDYGVLFNPDYSGDYSVGYEGVIYSSFFSTTTALPDGATFDPSAIANVEVRFAGIAKYPGFYSTNNGFVSDTIKVQDNYYYQIYSYVLRLDEQLETYRAVVKSLLHPAGMALFAEYELTTTGVMEDVIDLLDKISQTAFLDVAFTDDTVISFGVLKHLVDTATASDAKYLTMLKGFSDSVSTSDHGSMSATVPGNYDNYPTESYFDTAGFYTAGTTSSVASW